MTSANLRGVGVLVTRPAAQAAALIEAIELEGGRAIRFPVLQIEARAPRAIEADLAALPEPDIVIFASPNAVEHGLAFAADVTTGAIGPATASALQAGGRHVDICPADGYDSESLLAEALLENVSDKDVLIVRGNSGRKLLAEGLVERGATVNYLSVYDRKLAVIDPRILSEVESAWRDREIDAVTVMSVESLQNLITLLPEWCGKEMASMPLVTPAARVIKKALDLYPSSQPILASGPDADMMVAAIIENRCKTLRENH